MKVVTYHTFYTDNIPDYIVDLHKEVCKAMDVKVEYHFEKSIPKTENDPFPEYRMHGEMMERVLESADDDEVVGFLDIDCLPLNKNQIKEAEDYVRTNKTFCGNAQNIGHQQNRNFIYAAACYLVIHKSIWIELGKPPMKFRLLGGGNLIDTAMELTVRANMSGTHYQLFLPCGYTIETDKPHRLGPYGSYGSGTVYFNTWHLLRVSKCHSDEKIQNAWIDTCQRILEGEMILPKYKFLPYRLFNYF